MRRSHAYPCPQPALTKLLTGFVRINNLLDYLTATAMYLRTYAQYQALLSS
ncbi:hypothetical protein AO369_1835 [Moraxella catarrhalis]|nr:hypothetical protein AO369_1835 [Moraxella catarrhalis]